MHNLMGHMHLHSDSKPFKCLYCPSKFTLKGNLTRHMKVKHGVTERGFHSRGKKNKTMSDSANTLRHVLCIYKSIHTSMVCMDLSLMEHAPDSSTGRWLI